MSTDAQSTEELWDANDVARYLKASRSWVYHQAEAGRYSTMAKILTALGAPTVAAGGSRSRLVSIAGGTSILAGALAERWSVFRAGFQSAADPKYTVGPQRERVEGGRGQGASRKVAA